MDNTYQNALNKIECDEKCKLCIMVGPTGPSGISDTIQIGKVYTTSPYNEASITDTKIKNKHVLDFVIPRGFDGIPGPTGPALGKCAYLVTFNDSTNVDGIKIDSSKNIPIDRVELDVSNIITLNDDKTLKFNYPGYYKVSFIVNAYSKNHDNIFNRETDFVTIGFREINTDNIYIGSSSFNYNSKCATKIESTGIITIIDTDRSYELVNLSPNSIYLDSPDIKNIKSKSYFTNSVVTIVIDFLDKGK